MSYHPPSDTITFEAALRDLSSKSSKARVRAAHALGEVLDGGERERAARGLVTALDDDEPEVRAEAALSLGDLKLELAVAPLVERLRDDTALVRQSSAMALGKLGFRSGFEPLAAALTSAAPDLRFQAATSLVEIDAQRAYEPLLAALAEESDGEVVSAIALAIGAIGDRRATASLIAVLDDDRSAATRPQTRFEIAYALAELGHLRALDILRQFVTDEALGWDAIEGLEKLAEDDAVSSLARAVKQPRVANPIRLRAAAAIITIAPEHAAAEPAREALIAGLDYRKQIDCGVAVELIGRVGGDWAVAPLQRARSSRRGRRFADEIDQILRRLAGEANAAP